MEIVLIILVFITMLGCGYTVWRVGKIEQKFGHFFSESEKTGSVMERLNQYALQETSQNTRLEALEKHSKKLEMISERGHSRIGFVRFNPFSDTGGDQSFCLAVLDYHGNGWVISSIHARTGSRVYAKQIILGQSSHNLSDEEATAVTKALKQNPYQETHGSK